jgi:hypothetical protein
MISILGFFVSGLYLLTTFGVAYIGPHGFFGPSIILFLSALPWSFISENINLLTLFIFLNAVILYFISLGLERLFGKFAWLVIAVVILAAVIYFFVAF